MRREDFVQYLESEKRFSSHTVNAYLNDINQFELFLEETLEDEIALTQISHKHIRLWLVAMVEQGISAKTLNRKTSSLKTYFKFWVRNGELEVNPASKVIAPKIPKQLPEFVSSEAFDVLKEEVYDSTHWEGVREMVVIEFLYQTGIRVSELLGIKFSDVSLNQVKVLGKRNKERLIPISTELRIAVKNLEMKQKQELGDSPWLISTVSGKQGYPKLVYNIVTRLLSKVTTNNKKSPHVLRHTFATQMLNNGASLNSIKELLGHANLSATQVYTHNSFEKLKSIYNQAHPRA